MKKRTSSLFRLFCFALAFAAMNAALFADVVVIPIKGEINEAQFFFLRRAIKEAERGKADAILLDMDTYGGDALAAGKMMDALAHVDVPTFTFIDTNAASAGALISIATKHIYMAPTAAIGAAAPVTSGGEDLQKTMREKAESYLSARVRSACERNGYNPAIGDAFMKTDAEVKIGDTVVHAKGTLLTFSAQEAVKKIGGKPLLADGIVSSVDELIAKANLHGTSRRIEPAGFERLAFWVTELAPVLLMLGIVGVWVEIKMHGTFIPGALAALCFLLFFFGHYIAGLAGWEAPAMFVLGLALLLSELIIHPGTIIPGLLGVFLMIASLLWAMTDRYPSQPFLPTGKMLTRPVLNLSIAIIASAIVMALLGKYLPRTVLFSRFVLGKTNAPGASISPHNFGSPARVRIGEHGIATSILRPSGKAQFEGEVVDVVTQGGFVEQGKNVCVVEVEGARIVVEEVA
jgi:membrane-bound serine protease (ClpP class)